MKSGGSNLLPRREVIYCGACGMPPEYCTYSPDYETHCEPWLKKNHPDLLNELAEKRGDKKAAAAPLTDSKEPKPEKPWSVEERLTKFYEKYVPEKVEAVPTLIEKYAGKEDKLFDALIKKYGPEPLDPYYSDSDESNDDEGQDATQKVKTTSKRRGASAKQQRDAGNVRVVVQKQAQKKRRVLTVVTGLEPALAAKNQHKLKDASKAFSKRFAGSSSVKDGSIILQGDHVLELAEMIVDQFSVPEECVFVDMGDGEEMPLR